MGIFNKIKEVVLPFQAIAQELRILRELYEADLASRERPIIRITESPLRNDTEVSYSNDRRPLDAAQSLADEVLDEYDEELL